MTDLAGFLSDKNPAKSSFHNQLTLNIKFGIIKESKNLASGEERIFMKCHYLLLVVALGCFVHSGCDNDRNAGYHENDGYYYGNTDYPRYISVEVNNYSSGIADVYIGDAYVGSLDSGRSTSFSKSLYGGEKLRLKFVIAGSKEVYLNFDDDYQNYHVNLYNDHAEHF